MSSNTKGEPWVLGINASHNGSVCVLKGHRIVTAIQEERLTRVKRERILGGKPSLAVQYCLDFAGIRPKDLDIIVYSTQYRSSAPEHDIHLNPQLQPGLNSIPVITVSHHMAHAVSAFALSGFQNADILVIDGQGSSFEDLSANEQTAVFPPGREGWEIDSLYHGSGTTIHAVCKHMVPGKKWLVQRGAGMPLFHGLGGMYSAVTQQIFGNAMDAGKVMGLAAYGEPNIPVTDFFEIKKDELIFKDTVPNRFPDNIRWPSCKEEYQNLAASVQTALETGIMHMVKIARHGNNSPNLCYAGGVALNSVCNELILRKSGYRQIFIVPFAEDSGAAVGAAYYGLWSLQKENTRQTFNIDSLGKVYDMDEIDRAISVSPALQAFQSGDIIQEAAQRLAHGQIGGWFHRGSELGPRALGCRSILCDPRGPHTKDTVNLKIKHREPFRPFAPAILLEEVENWFCLDGFDPHCPFMLRVLKFHEQVKETVPAVVHRDGTARLQTVTEVNGDYYRLIKRFFQKTGVPILLNTSFNVMGEPIVETPEDALWCLTVTDLDFCVLGNRLVTRKPGFQSILDLRPFIKAPKSTIVNSIHGACQWGISSSSKLFLKIHTPWGNVRKKISPIFASLLSCIDGQRTGWEVMEAYNCQPGNALRKQSLQTLFIKLKREMIIDFKE